MERRLSAVSRRSAPSPIQQLSHLAQRVGAVNLAEGFPDFPAPPHVKAAAAAAIAADLNQYRFLRHDTSSSSSSSVLSRSRAVGAINAPSGGNVPVPLPFPLRLRRD